MLKKSGNTSNNCPADFDFTTSELAKKVNVTNAKLNVWRAMEIIPHILVYRQDGAKHWCFKARAVEWVNLAKLTMRWRVTQEEVGRTFRAAVVCWGEEEAYEHLNRCLNVASSFAGFIKLVNADLKASNCAEINISTDNA